MSLDTFTQRYAAADSSTAGTFAFDLISGTDYAISKLAFGALGTVTHVDVSNPLPVTVATITTLGTITNVVHVDDNSTSLTVDAPVGTPVFVRLSDGAAAISTLPVSLASVPSHAVTNAGTFAVQVSSALPAGTNAIGKLAANDGVDIGDVTINNASGASAVNVQDGGNSITVDGTVSVSGTVTIAGAVTNAGTFAVQDSQVVADNAAFTDGTTKLFMAGFIYDDTAGTALTENDAAAPRVSSNRAVVCAIEDGATRARYATVTASNALKVDGSAVTQPVSLSTIAVTNAGTFVVQENGAALTSLQLIDDIVYIDDTSTHSTGSSKGALIMAAATPTDTAVNANDIGALAMTLNRELLVQVNTALPAGTNAIGKLSANSGVTIGAVEIAAAQTLATVTTVTTVTTCSTVTTLSTLTGGGVAHDGVDASNPVKVGARAALTLSDDTMVANGDRTDNVSDADGALVVRPQFPLGDLVSERVSDTGGTSTAFSNFGATASTRNYVTAISLFNSSATAGYVDFRDGTAGSILWTVALPAGGGAVLSGDLPLFRTTASTALAYDVSAALTTVYISISGFRSKVA